MSGLPMKELLHDVNVAPDTKPKKVANNTIRYEAADGSTCWRLHKTDIVTVKYDVYTLNSGGWRTNTTKDRISTFAPVHVYADKGNWYVHAKHARGSPAVPFFDGMRVDATGKALDKPNTSQTKKDDVLRKKVNLFCRQVDAIETLPLPDSGDCWLCGMFDNAINGKGQRDGYTIGTDRASSVDHLFSHVDENYLHGSLMVNAMRATGHNDAGIGTCYQMNLRSTFKRALRRYLLRSFGLAA